MKKIISIVLSLICTVSLVNISLAAEEENVNYKYKHITDLGFMSGEEDPGYIVTRGEFAEIVCRTAGLAQTDAISVRYGDVLHGDKYFNSINAVTEAGYMHGYGDGSFRPSEPVTAAEAAKVMVNMAGYWLIAEASGGYEKGYMNAAHELELFRSVSSSGYNTAVKRRDLGIMIFNLMNAPVNPIFSSGYGTFSHSSNSQTFAEKYHGLRYITDIVKANSYTNFSRTISNVSENQLVIGEKLLMTDDFKHRFLIGRYASAFYDEETDRIVSIAERAEDVKIQRLMKYDIEILDGNSLSYTENSRSRTINFDNETIFIYNDKYVLSYDLTQLAQSDSCCIEIISSDRKGYEAVFIYDYYTVVSDGVSADYSVKSKLLPSNQSESQKSVSVDEDMIKNLIICDAEYDRMEAEDVLAGDVLTVITNTDYIRVMVSRNSVKREIKGVTADSGYKLLRCDGEEICAVPELEGFLAANVLSGKEVLIYTDIFGYAAYIAIDAMAAELCGVLVEEAKFIDENGEIEEKTIKFKIFSDSGEEANLFSSERITVGDTNIKLKSFSALPPELSGKSMVPVLYRLDEAGKVRKIVFPENVISGNKDGFFKGVSIPAAYYSTAQKTFGDKMGEGGQAEINEDTVAFIFKNGEYDSTSRVVKGTSLYNGATDYDLEAYYKSRSNDIADILLIKTDLQKANQNSFAAVITKSGVEELYNEEICSKLEYMQNGTIKAAYANKAKYEAVDVSAVNAGDTVLMEIDAQGYISGIFQIYDYKNDILNCYNSDNRWSYIATSVGYVVRNSNGRIRTSSVKETINDSTVFEKPLHVLSNYQLVMVENKDKITKCSGEDIKLGDKVVFVTRAGAGRVIVIYK